MKALVLEGPGQFTFQPARPAPADPPSADSVLVRVAACGICGSDLPRAFDAGGAYHYPLVLGHEFSAVVEEDAHGVKAGDRMRLKIGGPNAISLDEMLVRVDKSFKLEVHIDTDEGNACNLQPETPVQLTK